MRHRTRLKSARRLTGAAGSSGKTTPGGNAVPMEPASVKAPPKGRSSRQLETKSRLVSGSAGGAQASGAALLAGAGVLVQRPALDGAVDQRHKFLVIGVGGRIVAGRDGGLEAAEVRLDRGRVAAVL